MRERRMKILMDDSREVRAEHAKAVVKALDDADVKDPRRAVPQGIAFHTAHYPILCDDCGSTYWSRDPYASHLRCPGGAKQRAGFG